MSSAEFVRLVAFSSSGAILALIAIWIYAYWLEWRKPGGRAIPIHVLAFMFFGVNAVVKDFMELRTLIERDGDLTPFAPMTLIGNVVMVIGLLAIFTYDKRHISKASRSPKMADRPREEWHPRRRRDDPKIPDPF